MTDLSGLPHSRAGRGKIDFEVPVTEDGSPHFYFTPSLFACYDVPEREWLIEGWLPKGQIALLTGDGGTGKSLLGQQLATCIATEQPFLGLEVPAGMSAVYLTCEDDQAELHRRQDAICRSLGVDMEDIDTRLYLIPLRGQIGNELMGPDLSLTSAFHKLARTISTLCHRGFIVLDNVAHLFAGNENDRHHVATFYAAIDKLAMEYGCTIVLLAHPPKNGAEFSGSTAWENQVRTRLYLSRPTSEDGFDDPDSRTLSRSKANYARTGDRLTFRWVDWAFQAEAENGPSWSERMAETAADAAANERFLACLDKLNHQRRPVSPSSHAGNYAPKVMAQMPSGRGMDKAAFKRAMERLFEVGAIIGRAELWRDEKRMPVFGIARLNAPQNDCRPVAARLPEGSPEPSGKEGQVIDIACRPVVPPGLPSGLPLGSSQPPGKAEQVIDIACRPVAARLPGGSGGSEGGEPPLKGGRPPAAYSDPWELSDEDWEPMP